MTGLRATARLQIHKGFSLDDAAEQVPYFAGLGISHLYLSPILTARSGSMHGYDVVDHGQVSQEIGGEDALRRLVARLRTHDMGLVVDIVPNHMAVGRDDNAWWLDVLESGRNSRFAAFFDIDWDVPDPALRGKVLAPFLGKPYGEALEAGEIALKFDAGAGRFYAAYYEHRFPVSPETYAPLLRASGDLLAEHGRAYRDVFAKGARGSRHERFDALCADLAKAARDPAGGNAIATLLGQFDATGPEGRGRLHRLLERQHYRLAWFRAATDEINWRRFFDVIDLAGLRIQEPAVFDAVHATTLRLYAEGLIDGVRVDHVDGLADPRAYCRKLRARLKALEAQRPKGVPGGPAYFVVEKILAPGELLALDWQVDGTSGYVFMNEVGALFHDPRGGDRLKELWSRQTGNSGDFDSEVRRARRRIPQELLSADFNACAHALHAIARAQPTTRDWSLEAIRRVLAELLVHFPVYRTYVDGRGRSAADAAIMARVVADAKTTCRPAERVLVDAVDGWLGGVAPLSVPGSPSRRARLRAIARFQQLTSPVAAKSVEDTAFYRHGTLLSRNEVGADPAQFSMSPEAFDRACADRLRRYPDAMLATATHDHKRGEDLRLRLATLSEVPDLWAETVGVWVALNAHLKPVIEGVQGPDDTDEYMLYQMLVGAWPMSQRADDAEGLADLAGRLAGWQEKAVREAKRRSGWIEPNLSYEAGCRAFLEALLDPARSEEFLSSLEGFVASIALAGAINSFGQTLLRNTTPGVPDLYQGTEFWDFSLVDPDNRRPVDFVARRKALAEARSDEELMSGWRDGHLKQQLIARTLRLRGEMPGVFQSGTFVPLKARGPQQTCVYAFLREHAGRAILVVVARCTVPLVADGEALSISPESWQGTRLDFPRRYRERRWRNALSDEAIGEIGKSIPVSVLFGRWPVALLVSESAAQGH